jgi:hypothetical protein
MYKKFNQIQKLEIAANAIDNDSPILLLHKFGKIWFDECQHYIDVTLTMVIKDV